MKILFAEDTHDLSRAVCAVLSHEGHVVDPVYDGAEALEHLMQDSYDCIVLDIMMPKMDGIQALKELRQRNILTPVLMLTAKSEVEDRINGLDSGADDYLSKPFAMKELLARIRALTRRKTVYQTDLVRFEDLSLNSESFELSCENTVRLSVREYELMQTLLLNNRQNITQRFLLDHVWKNEPDADDETIALYISYLRRKLKAISSKVEIRTLHAGGYRLCVMGDPE